MTTFELLDAVWMRGTDTDADVATALGISLADAKRQLRQAEDDGLVQYVNGDRSHGADPEKWAWHLTSEGMQERDRIDPSRDK